MKKLLAAAGTLMLAYVLISASWSAAPRTGGEGTDNVGSPVYVMCEEGGRVVVYRDEVLWLRTDTTVASLPKNDREKLKNGIIVFSEEELKQLIEDYCS